ncbi:MAG: BamA/TamA family outer membrane protein [Candidatus Eisenbacteria bacterium]|nr:BamA/TamA family outer membrane protein [Candidatus Eisenbacteria bacterium]
MADVRFPGAILFLFVAATLAVLAPASPSVAASREIEGYKGWNVAEFRIEGVDRDLAARLQRGLSVPSRIKRFRVNRPLLYPSIVEEDLRRTRLFLARNGYPYARVGARAEIVGGYRNVRVVLTVDPGPAARVAAFDLEGFPAPLDPIIRERSPIRAGDVFTEDALSEATHTARETLKENGYADAVLESSVEREGDGSVRVLFRADPGPVFHLGGVRVEGASEDLVPLVRKTITVPRGVLYSPERIREAGDAIRILQLFRRIRVETAPADGDTLDLVAALAERRHRTVSVDIGYWTDDLLRGSARWEHRNLLRRGRGGAIGVSASRYRQNAGGSLWWPALFLPRLRGDLSLSATREWEESYDLLSLSFRVGGTHRPSLRSTLSAGVSLSRVDVNVTTDAPDAFVEEGGILGAFRLEGKRDGGNDRLDPTAGTVAFFALEWSPPGPWTDSPYASAEASLAGYHAAPVGAVLAARAGIGIARPLGDSPDLLPNKRFYSGGANTMRGFRRRKLGPLDDEGAPLGGEAKAEFSVEARFPLFWRFRGAFFADAGQVWSRRDEIDWRDMEAAIGPGMMVRTPVGPIRADVGFRLTDKEKDQPGWVFHLSIGNPY